MKSEKNGAVSHDDRKIFSASRVKSQPLMVLSLPVNFSPSLNTVFAPTQIPNKQLAETGSSMAMDLVACHSPTQSCFTERLASCK